MTAHRGSAGNLSSHVCSSELIGIFFFFQAEDGIRDKLVTGVQTCALPISSRTSSRILVGRELVLDVLPERSLQRVGLRIALLEDDKGFRLDELVLVFGSDHRDRKSVV